MATDPKEQAMEITTGTELLLEQLATTLYQEAEYGDQLDAVSKVRTYEEAGVLTRDAGLVLTTVDGAEYQLTLVRSR
jgi:hypothetical protein